MCLWHPLRVRILLIRHGESMGNVDPAIHRHTADHAIPLSPRGREQVREAGHEQAPSFVLEDARSGYREGVREDGPGQREVFVRAGADERERSAPVAGLPGLVVDAGFDSFLRKHWTSLAAGQPQRFEFLLPSRLQAYPFSLSQSGEDLIDGTPVRRFRLQLDAWYAFAVPAISLAYERDTKRIREYTGVSNIRNAAGKSLKVRIEFPPGARAVLPDSVLVVPSWERIGPGATQVAAAFGATGWRCPEDATVSPEHLARSVAVTLTEDVH